jgi:hypothetical protein
MLEIEVNKKGTIYKTINKKSDLLSVISHIIKQNPPNKKILISVGNR